MSDEVSARFIETVTRKRLDRGISLTEFARRAREEYGLPFHPATVVRIEKGERPLKLNEAAVMARMLDADLADLLAEGSGEDQGARLQSAVDRAIDARHSAQRLLRQTSAELNDAARSLHRALEAHHHDDELHEKATELLATLDTLSDILKGRGYFE